MELQQIRELIELMKDNDLTEVRINQGQTRLLLKRGPDPMNAPVTVTQQPLPAPAPAAPPQPVAQPETPVAGQEDDGLVTIDSPMVGTFYAAPSPDSDPYVRTSDHVSNDTVVCIIEAMKVMNEIKAETAGTIVKVLVENGQPVEFGQALFQVRPD